LTRQRRARLHRGGFELAPRSWPRGTGGNQQGIALQAAPQTKSAGGAMKAREIFDVCHGRYRSLREWVADSNGDVRSLDLEKPASGYQWRPNRARACEYVADFERIGRHALRRPEWKGRLKLFEIYFLGSFEYRTAIRLVGVSEGTFDYWYREVKRALGAEFSRTGLYPPARYFSVVRAQK
jgi:hypothetical protein